MTDKYEAEKPDTTKVLEQGYGYVRVQVGFTLPAPDDHPFDVDSIMDLDESWRRAQVVNPPDGQPYGVLATPGGQKHIPIEKLLPTKPGGQRI